MTTNRLINLYREAQAIRTRFRRDMSVQVDAFTDIYMTKYAESHTPEQTEQERARIAEIQTREYPPVEQV